MVNIFEEKPLTGINYPFNANILKTPLRYSNWSPIIDIEPYWSSSHIFPLVRRTRYTHGQAHGHAVVSVGDTHTDITQITNPNSAST